MNEMTRVVAAPVDLAAAFTSDDFARMLEAGAFEDMRAELVEGRLEKMAPAYGEHGQRNFDVAHKLHQAFEGREVAIAIDLAVRMHGRTTRGLDVAVGLASFPVGEAARGADVFLAVEIADTTLSRDLGLKALDLARAGVPHYWVVDLNARAVHVMGDPTEDGYNTRTIVRFGEDLAVPGTDATITLG